MKPKHYFALTLAYCSFSAISLHAADTYDIGATRHKVASAEHEINRRGPGPKTLDHEIDVYQYDLKIRSKSPNNPSSVNVQYIVYVEQMKGRVTPAASGTGTSTTPLGKTTSYKTNPFHLRSVELDRKKRRDLERDTELDGYAVRLLHPDSHKVLAEKYSSSQIKTQVDWTVIADKQTPKTGIPQRIKKKPLPGKKR